MDIFSVLSKEEMNRYWHQHKRTFRSEVCGKGFEDEFATCPSIKEEDFLYVHFKG